MQGRPKYRINKSDIIIATGVDAFDDAGTRKRRTLALPNNMRTDFFAQRPELLQFLQQVSDNPPIEEGYYISQANRQRNGEYFLTTEGSRTLIELLVRNKYSEFNVDNIMLIDDDTKELEEYIKQWQQTNAVDCKIAYVNFRHHITLYLRNIDGKPHCFILDTQPNRRIDNVTSAVHAALPDAEITLSTTPLQLDFFSCPVFALKALRFYVKHGAELFDYIQSKDREWNDKLHAFELKRTDLMPQLLKMLQSRMTLPDSVLNAIVSKPQQTLKEQLDQYAINIDGKTYNAKSFIKRYQYLDFLYNKLVGNQYHDERTLHELVRDNDFKAILNFIETTNIHDLHDNLRKKDAEQKTPFEHLSDLSFQANPEKVNQICKSLRERYMMHKSLFRDLLGRIGNMSFTNLLSRPKPKNTLTLFSPPSRDHALFWSRKKEKHIKNKYNRY